MSILFPGSQQGAGVVVRDASTEQQAFAATVREAVVGTILQIPPGGLKVGSRYRAKLNITKTAAGTATTTVDVSIGSSSDGLNTARLSFTKPAGTAVADEGVIEVEVLVRAVDDTTGVIVGEFTLGHNLAATGHATVPFVAVYATSGSFDNSDTEADYISVSLTTGASDVITVELASAELVIPTNG